MKRGKKIEEAYFDDDEDFCHCNMDPLTERGRLTYLVGMIGLPIMPAIFIFAFSSAQLSLHRGYYHQTNDLKQVVSQIQQVETLLTALQDEMEVATTLVASHGLELLGQASSAQEKTNEEIYATTIWPRSDILPWYDSKSMLSFLDRHRAEFNGGSNTTVIAEYVFYQNVIDSTLNWISDLTESGVKTDLWSQFVSHGNLLSAVHVYCSERVLGNVYFFSGALGEREHRLYTVAQALADVFIEMTITYNAEFRNVVMNFWEKYKDIKEEIDLTRQIIAVNENGTEKNIAEGIIWYNKHKDYKERLANIVFSAARNDTEQLEKELDLIDRNIAFHAVVIAVTCLIVVPFVVLSGTRTFMALFVYATTMDRKSVELRRGKRRTENLLCEMLPRSIAYRMRKGEEIPAEYFDNVTVFFSDIMDFLEISMASNPYEIVAFLNDIYIFMDEQIGMYDAYKVETIDCTYMLVSGLPMRNGLRHATEIARLALHLMEATGNFIIPHLPDRPLLFRVGIHSGPVVAGVVGNKMPRYCLFGDTVNTASRMQSNSLARRVQMSNTTQELLQQTGGFHTEMRGDVFIKGKGVMKTYWLTGRQKKIKTNSRLMKNTSTGHYLQ